MSPVYYWSEHPGIPDSPQFQNKKKWSHLIRLLFILQIIYYKSTTKRKHKTKHHYNCLQTKSKSLSCQKLSGIRFFWDRWGRDLNWRLELFFFFSFKHSAAVFWLIRIWFVSDSVVRSAAMHWTLPPFSVHQFFIIFFTFQFFLLSKTRPVMRCSFIIRWFLSWGRSSNIGLKCAPYVMFSCFIPRLKCLKLNLCF